MVFQDNFIGQDADGEKGAIASWELRVEGRLIDDDKRVDPSKTKRKFSSFFKVKYIVVNTLIIERLILIKKNNEKYTYDSDITVAGN